MTAKRDYWPTREWQAAAPEAAGMRSDRLAEMDRALSAQYGSIHGMVVVRHGCIVFERYNHGFCPDDTHPVASVTKSFTSALIGIAIDAEYIQGVDQKALDFFPEHQFGGHRREVTIRHLLTMTVPFAWKPGMRGNEPLDRLRRQPDWVAFILDQMAPGGPPGRFQYSSAASHLLSAIITRATGVCAREFANERLFGPIGMRQIADQEMGSFSTDDVFGQNITGWIKDPQGNSTGGWGLCVTPRDMARFGFLYLNGGAWDGRPVVPEGWVAESTAPNANGYGYQWWLRGAAFAASGYGGSHIFCVPDKDLVVAIASKLSARSRDRWLLLNRYILPAVED